MIKKIKDNKLVFLLVVFVLFLAIYIMFKPKVTTTKIAIQEEEEEEEEDIDDIIKQIEKKKR